MQSSGILSPVVVKREVETKWRRWDRKIKRETCSVKTQSDLCQKKKARCALTEKRNRQTCSKWPGLINNNKDQGIWIIKGNADGRKLEPNQKETSSVWSHLQLYCWHAHSDRCEELDCLSIHVCVFMCLYTLYIMYIIQCSTHICKYTQIHKYEFQFDITSA